MRPAALLFAAVALGSASVAAALTAAAIVTRLEARSEAEVAAAYAEAGLAWAAVETDGLRVALTGLAPDERARSEAFEVASRIVDPGRIADRIEVRAAGPAPDIDFALELMRSRDQISAIGLIPEGDGSDPIAETVASLGVQVTLTDLVDIAPGTLAPPGWTEKMRLALTAVRLMPFVRVSLRDEAMTISGMVATRPELLTVEERLQALRPPDLALTLDLRAPQPVIVPYRFAASLGRDGLTVETCAADTAALRDQLLEQVVAIDSTAGAVCRVGLGAPSPLWADAVMAGLAALDTLRAGTFEVEDLKAVLRVPAAVPEEDYAAVVASLAGEIPPGFSFEARRLPAPPQGGTGDGEAEEGEGTAEVGPSFSALLEPGGTVRLAGVLPTATSREAVVTFADALFDEGEVIALVTFEPTLSPGWPRQVMAALEALDLLYEGRLEIDGGGLTLSGLGDSADIARAVEARLQESLGLDTPMALDIRFVPRPVEVEATAMPAELCVAAIGERLAAEQILFAPSSATIAPESLPVIEAIAAIMRDCGDTVFEVAGHTDASGRAEANLALSQARADSVVDALLAQGVFVDRMQPRGYGETEPIADNETDEGKARNRRIEFRLAPEETASPEDEAAEEEEAAADGQD
ncbi:MAG: OmpA family protein [Pseudomonadota bacterium]